MDARPEPNAVLAAAKEQLISIIERIERLEEEKAYTAGEIRDIYAETKALRRIVRMRRMDESQKAAQAEVEAIVETYMVQLGMFS